MSVGDDAGGRPAGAGPPPDDPTLHRDAVAPTQGFPRPLDPALFATTSLRRTLAMAGEGPGLDELARIVRAGGDRGFLHVGRRAEAPA